METEQDDRVGSQEFGNRFLSGLSWTATAQLVSQVVTFLAGVLLARLLVPNDFGTVAMVLVYTNFIWLLGQAGFNSAIVYLDDVSDTDLSTMYWANLCINVVLCGTAVVLAPVVGGFFGNDQVVPLIRVGSLGLVFAALGGAQRALLEKRLEFGSLARSQLSASVVYAASAVAMALAGLGVWALIVGRLLEQVAESTFVALASGWRPRMVFSRVSLQRLQGYGGRVWLGNMLFYGQENIDNLIVGRVLGATPLGYYSFAFRLANVARWFFAGVISRVVFPSFSSGRKQPEVLRRAYLRVLSYSILIAIGLCLGLALVAPEFVSVVYGAKWLSAVSALQVLAVAGGLLCVGQVTAPVLLSLGRPGLHAKVLLASTSVLIAGALLGVRWGVVGVAAGVLASACVVFVLGQVFVLRALEVSLTDYGRATLPPATAIAVMSLTVVVWRWLGLGALHLSQGVWLVSAIAFGAAALMAGLVATRAPQIPDMIAMRRRFRARREPKSARVAHVVPAPDEVRSP